MRKRDSRGTRAGEVASYHALAPIKAKPFNAGAIYNEGKAAAQKAAEEENARLPPEQNRGFDCGFGWVMIRPARGPFVAWCKSMRIGASVDWGAAGRGYYISGGGLNNLSTQSVSVHYASAKAFADVLKAHGITVEAYQRLD